MKSSRFGVQNLSLDLIDVDMQTPTETENIQDRIYDWFIQSRYLEQ